MITVYCGGTGSGKSYTMVERQILTALKLGRFVVSNIPLTKEWDNYQYTTELDDFLNAPPAALILIDEAWDYFPSSLTVKQMSDAQKSFFTMHRHKALNGQSQDIVLGVQSPGQLPKFVRDLVHQTFYCEKTLTFGFSSGFRVIAYTGTFTDTNKRPKGQKIAVTVYKYSKTVFAEYKSVTAGDGVAGQQQQYDNRAVIWRSPSLIFAGISIISLFFLVPSVFSFFSPPERKLPEVKKEEPVKVAKVEEKKEEPFVGPPRPPSYPVSQEFRITGVISSPAGSFAFVQHLPMARAVKVPLSQCEGDFNGDMSCIYAGVKVTRFSGSYSQPRPSVAASGSGGGFFNNFVPS